MKKSLAFLKNPRFRYGSLSTLILCLLLAALVGVNFVFGALAKRTDGAWIIPSTA